MFVFNETYCSYVLEAVTQVSQCINNASYRVGYWILSCLEPSTSHQWAGHLPMSFSCLRMSKGWVEAGELEGRAEKAGCCAGWSHLVASRVSDSK